jgi:predicted amidohydrolase
MRSYATRTLGEMFMLSRVMFVAALLIAAGTFADAAEKTLRVGVVQLEMSPTPETPIKETLDANLAKAIRFIHDAKNQGCQLVVFHEHTLFWPVGVVDFPCELDVENALDQIRNVAGEREICVVVGTAANRNGEQSYKDRRAYVFGVDGEIVLAYWKNKEVPRPFDVAGVTCNLAICSDRWYLEQSDLPSVVSGAQVIVDISGGHGGDDGRTGDLHLIRYRPWANRTDAYVLVSNPVHASVDFMGHSPWGGGSAIVGPDGSVLKHQLYEKDKLIVADIRVDEATLAAGKNRRNHPIFKEFWDAGERLLQKGTIETTPDIEPYRSVERDVTIAAAQIVCSNDLKDNTKRILDSIHSAAAKKADIVVFPELALTGSQSEDVAAANPLLLDKSLRRIRREARDRRIHVIVGAPRTTEAGRQNCAYVIDDEGAIKTCYAQIATSDDGLFQPGKSTKAMWFVLNGVRSIVTIGSDANWIEIPELAAGRGMILHFHLTNEVDHGSDDSVLRRQRNLLALQYAQFGAVVNAADPTAESEVLNRGDSLLVCREGGHNQPAPPGVECYLPYQTSVVRSAGPEATIIYATRRTPTRNSRDLKAGRNRRLSKAEPSWYDWIKQGVRSIESEAP